MKIQNEEDRHIDPVRAVPRAAFPGDAESRLVHLVRANGNAVISLVALTADEVLGHILFSPVTLSPPPPSVPKGLGLAPVAVRPDVQSQGIGRRLVEEGLRVCKELGFDYCVVLGSPEYYRRFGFEKASPFGIQNEYGVDDEFMFIRFTDRRVTGLVKYSSEFGELDV